MRKRAGKWALPVLAAFALVFSVYHVVRAQQTLPPPPPPLEPARAPFDGTIAGAGIVEARSDNIAIGAAIPGLVLEVYGPKKPGLPAWSALIGQPVKAGDPLFCVDDRQLRAQLAYHEANLRAARSQAAKLEAMPRQEELPPAEARVRTAEASVNVQLDLAERGRRLNLTRAMSAEDARQRALALAVARERLAQAEADLALLRKGAWRYDKEIAAAAVEVAQAQVKQTRTDIDRALVRAPVDGVVLQVNVRPGEYVSTPSAQPLIVLGDTRQKVHVRVDIDEHDIPRFQAGAPARGSVRGRPEASYPLEFVRVEPYVVPKKSLTGENTERVDTRVLQVIYALEVKGRSVYVGQQLDVFLDVGAGGGPPGSEATARRLGK
jgi:multidrug efflux pump subunit AcrA (membrane-fusion protein)